MRLATLLTLLLVIAMPAMVALGQPTGGGPGGGGPPVPITGIEFLIGGGAILGLRRLLGHIKSRKNQQ